MRSTFILVLSLFASVPVFAQNSTYFYHGREFGSESMINPGSLILNAGFDILQSATHSRELSTMRLGKGFRNVWDNMRDPFTQIRKFGWNRFLSQEVIPTSLDISKAQYFPNYTLHLIGGGMDSRMMYEWFTYHDVPLPTAMTVLTITAYHLINEAAENDFYRGPNVDPIADLYIFDIGGAVLFTSDAVCDYFSSTLHMTAWPVQPAWNPTYNTLENNGQFYVIRYRPPWWERTSLFYQFGDNGMLGLSFAQDHGESVTASAGFAARDLRTVDDRNGARTVTVTLGWIAGVFWDRDNSLLASLLASNRVNEKLKLNIYPGVLNIAGCSPGMFVSVGRGGQMIAGVTVRWSPVGLAWRSGR